MNFIILEERERLDERLFRLSERKSNHILKILKSKLGDSLKAGLLDSSLGFAYIHAINKEKREVIVEYKADNAKLSESRLSFIRVFSALQRPQTTKKMIQFCANCGIRDLFFFPAEKSELSYGHSSLWEEDNLREEILLGLEQGGRVFSPSIQILKNKFKIKEHLVGNKRYLLDFKSPYLDELEASLAKEEIVNIIIGPESGLREEDNKFFIDLGFQSISVSENILRSEIALVYFVAQFELLVNGKTKNNNLL